MESLALNRLRGRGGGVIFKCLSRGVHEDRTGLPLNPGASDLQEQVGTQAGGGVPDLFADLPEGLRPPFPCPPTSGGTVSPAQGAASSLLLTLCPEPGLPLNRFV